MSKSSKIQNVPTNVITGFLGTGKTSAILHLLATRHGDERWAVLVNEFGEIGVDGSLFEGQHREENGVFVHQLPGGCMCCTAGLPMQVALNALLRRSHPDRLLIEPTGLGHPSEVLGVLAGPQYAGVLELHKVITMVDARQLSDERYTKLKTFNEQIEMADVLVGNKADLYGDEDREVLKTYVAEHGAPHAELRITEQAAVDPSWLDGATRSAGELHHHNASELPSGPSLSDMPLPDSGFLMAENEGDGFQSVGWRVTPERIFDRQRLQVFLSGLEAERMKGVFITESGIFSYNFAAGTLTETALDECLESRVEILAREVDASWQGELIACLVEEASS